ncbi:MAG: Co2+/Mg2+ efflux protein ApaG [Phycisphaerales bacterium]
MRKRASKGSNTITHGIRVRVEPQYLPHESQPDLGRFFFAYRVTITNEGDRRARLHTRHWRIVDADGDEREVNGPGVIGEFPDLAPGESFQYVSYCPLETEWGTMEGSYRFETEDGATLEVEVDRFYLVAEAPAPTPISTV